MLAAEVRGRTWVTRKNIHVDRIASAWIIRRFFDPEACFKFVSGKAVWFMVSAGVGSLPCPRLLSPSGEEDRARRLHGEGESTEAPQREQRLDDEPAAERVEAEQRREPEDDPARPQERRGLRGLRVLIERGRELAVENADCDRDSRIQREP
ncbi:chromate resistance protein ChrB domain-containing protein [Sorangium sp. So ce693]